MSARLRVRKTCIRKFEGPTLKNTGLGYAGKHADPWGQEFGQSNTVWLLQVADLRIVHLGDNGPLRDETIRELGHVDVLMMPIDSQFHILKAEQIAAIRSKLSPRILIPMHYVLLRQACGSPKNRLRA